MLIEFSVSNFRSFRERQTFQMTAAPRLGKKENTFAPDVEGEKLPHLLKVAAIYGGNASGKTSLITAIGVIEQLAKRKPDAESKPLPVSPFRFDPELAKEPSTFEVHFIWKRVRYQFRVAATIDRITEETLYMYPRGKEVLLYSRSYEDGAESYEFGPTFEGDEILRSAWRRLTAPKSLFISQAVLNSSEELVQLRNPFAWMQAGMIVLDGGLDRWSNIGRRVPTDDSWSSSMSSFLGEVDIPITDVRFEASENGDEGDNDEEQSSPIAKKHRGLQKSGKTTLTHKTRLGEAKFDYSEESRGTQNLIGMFLPWKALSIDNPNEEKLILKGVC